MLRMIFVADTFVAGAFGLGLVFAPDLLFSLYGMHSDTTSEFLARLLGAFVLGQAPMLWWARDHVATPAGLAITRGHGIIDMVSTVLCTQACLRGIMNGQGWVVVVLFALFGSGRIYYGFIATTAPVQAGSAR
jgi:hypothetical protein